MNPQQLAYEAGWKTALATKNKNESGRGIPTWLINQDKEIEKALQDILEKLDESRQFIAQQEDSDYNGDSNWLGKSAADYSGMSVDITNALKKLQE